MRIWFADAPDRLRLPSDPGALREATFVILEDTPSTMALRQALVAGGAAEFPRSELAGLLRVSFKDVYSRFIAELNGRNAGFGWWALTFTNKNPIATPLCDQVFNLLALRELIHSRSGERLIVGTSDAALADQARRVFRGAEVVSLVPRPARWRAWLPIGPVFGLARALALKGAGWMNGFRRPAAGGGPFTVLFSLFNHQSLTADGRFRDAYFGDLADELLALGENPLVMGQTMQNARRTLDDISRARPAYPVLPAESCATLFDLGWCFVRALIRFIAAPRFAGEARVDGTDVSRLVRAAIRSNARSSRYFTDLLFHVAAARIVRTVKVSTFVYPFENRTWEKMILLAVRTHSAGTRLVGYQHASLTPKHLNFVFEPGEASYTPLPDRVVTMGEITKSFMEQYGRFPSRLLSTGCALRRAVCESPGARSRPERVRRILVTLATDYKEYVGVFRFLEKALAKSAGLEVRVRPHPVYPLDEAERRWGPFKFDYEEDRGPLAESLRWADVVLYASSTLGLDAVSMGIPAVYIEWGDYLPVDPIASLSRLKWTVSRPGELTEVFEAIESMTGEDFRELQRDAREFAAAYSGPVTETGVRAFVASPRKDSGEAPKLAVL